MLCKISPTLWWGYGGLFIIQLSRIQNQVSKVFDGILVYVFHEGFDVSFKDVKVG